MKTKSSKSRELPRPIRILFFICSIAVVCLPNWIALKAGKPVVDPADFMTNLAVVLEEETEPEIELQDWMLSFDEFNIVADVEPAIQLEDWMLDFGYEPRMADVNLKPYTEAWISEFESRDYTDYRIRY